MPKIIGNSKVVVDDGAGLTINELVGNVATNEDKISIAHVKVANPASEPWLTLHYDEYICVLAGKMILQHSDGELEVNAGDSVFIKEGERFRPVFPGRYIIKVTNHISIIKLFKQQHSQMN